MSAEVFSQAGFAFGHYVRSVHAAPALSELAVSRRSFVASNMVSRSLYQLGCTLEDRTIAAIGARIGVFPLEDVTEWLTADDAKIRALRDSGEETDAWSQLPALLLTEDLLEARAPMESAAQPRNSEADDFRSFLRFRRCFDGADLRGFMTDLLFSSEEQWEYVMTTAATQAEVGWWSRSQHEWPIAFGIFDAVRAVAEMLAWKVGGAINESDPWGMAQGPQDSGPPIRFEYLRKTDGGTPRMVKEALVEAVSGPEGFAAITDSYNLLDEAILLKVLQFARLPQDPDDRTEQRRRIIEVIFPSDETRLALRLGPRFMWAASLWRLAPGDRRSQSRAAQATDVMKRAIHYLLSNTDAFFVADRMVFFPAKNG